MTRKRSIRAGAFLGYMPLLNSVFERDRKTREFYCYIPLFSSVFERDQKTGSLTEDAALYQSILRFGTTRSDKKGFRFAELANWLLRNHKSYVEYYIGSRAKTPYNTRLAHTKDRINSRIRDLINLKLMCENGSVRAEKNKQQYTGLYDFTVEGYFFGFLLESTSPQQKNSHIYPEADDQVDTNVGEKTYSDFILRLLIITKRIGTGLVYELSLFGLMLVIAIIMYRFAGSHRSDRHHLINGIDASFGGHKLLYNSMDLKQCFDTVAENYRDKVPLIFGKWNILRPYLGLMLYDGFDFLIYKDNRSYSIEETVWFSGTKEYYDDLQALTRNAIKLLYPIYVSGTSNIRKFEKHQPWIANNPNLELVYLKLREIGEILKYAEILSILEKSRDRGHSAKILLKRPLPTTSDDIKSIERIFKDELSFLYYLTLHTNTLSKSYQYSSRPSRSKTGMIVMPQETMEVFELGGPENRLMMILNQDKDIRNWFSRWIGGVLEYRRQTSEKMLEFYGLITNPKGHKREIRMESNANRKAVAVYEEYDIKKICIDDFDSTYDYSNM